MDRGMLRGLVLLLVARYPWSKKGWEAARLQSLVYLLQEDFQTASLFGAEYKFDRQESGVHSCELDDHLRFLVKVGFVSEQLVGEGALLFRVTSLGLQAVRRVKERLSLSGIPMGRVEEAVATLLKRYGKVPSPGLVTLIEERKAS